MNTTLLIALVLFLTGFISDLIVQVAAGWSEQINLFRPYWDRYGTIGAAIIAGFISLIFGGLFLLLAIEIYRILDLQIGYDFIFFSTALGFVLGYIGDVIVNRYNLFGPTLRKWYDGMGIEKAGLWSGGLTFAFIAFVASTVLVIGQQN